MTFFHPLKRVFLAVAVFSTLLASVLIPALADDEKLSLSEAVAIAVRLKDPSVSRYHAQADSAADLATAQSQLPDPKVKMGVVNIAVNSFNFSQEPMTQLQFGAHQSFPSAQKRGLIRERGQAQGNAYRQMAAAQRLMITLDVRKLWLRVHMLTATKSFIEAKKANMQALITALNSQYGSGDLPLQNLLLMETELALLDDKIEENQQHITQTRLKLARYIGEKPAMRPLATAPDLPSPRPAQLLQQDIGDHPMIGKEKALIDAAEKSVGIARADYKPTWGLDVGYGVRGGNRADMATAMVTLDVPLFTKNRQDKRLSAAKSQKQSAELTRRALALTMVADMRASFSVWTKASHRITLYHKVLLQRSKAAIKATEEAYASTRSDLAAIIRSHLSELAVYIKLEDIKYQRALAQAELLYYQGDES